MAFNRGFRKVARARYLGAILGAALLCAGGSANATSQGPGWELERGVAYPSYAIVDPASTNMNIDAIVLSCVQGAHHTGLQLQILLSTASPLRPHGSTDEELKPDPAASIVVDGRLFPVRIFFGDDYVVLADQMDGQVPLLSLHLLNALQSGQILFLHFDVLTEPEGMLPALDGQAVVDLQAGMGGRAVAAVRRCAVPPSGNYAAGLVLDAPLPATTGE